VQGRREEGEDAVDVQFGLGELDQGVVVLAVVAFQSSDQFSELRLHGICLVGVDVPRVPRTDRRRPLPFGPRPTLRPGLSPKASREAHRGDSIPFQRFEGAEQTAVGRFLVGGGRGKGRVAEGLLGASQDDAGECSAADVSKEDAAGGILGGAEGGVAE